MAGLIDRITKLEQAAPAGTMSRQELDAAADALLAKLKALPGPFVAPTEQDKCALFRMLKQFLLEPSHAPN